MTPNITKNLKKLRDYSLKMRDEHAKSAQELRIKGNQDGEQYDEGAEDAYSDMYFELEKLITKIKKHD